MEITLEKIELVKDRTGVSYAEAKEALEAAEGSVVDAIISIEETIDHQDKKSFGGQGTAIVDKLKELVKKGNVSKILVKRDDDVILNLPVNAGILGAIVAPWGAVLGVVAAFGFKCTIEVVKEDGTVIDVSDSVSDTVENVVEKGGAVADNLKDKGADIYQDAKSKSADIYESAKAKASDAIDNIKRNKEEDIDFSGCFADDEEPEEEKKDEEEAETEEKTEEKTEDAAKDEQ